MVAELVSAMCVLGIVILGMLVMTRTITWEELIGAIGRFLLVILGALIAFCLLKILLVAVVVPWLASLKALLLWFALAAIAIIALAFITRMTASRFQRRRTATASEKGERQ